MSHTLAARCVVCGVTEDAGCPECGTPAGSTHGTAFQRPFKTVLSDGSLYQWHPDCVAGLPPGEPGTLEGGRQG